ncbi:MAG: SiaB family protein kinase [Microscillaceae bacterium]|nr:SiaB family protein kinase [Microscillaceae bacterium]MDW8459826.1 SiaB family protein kinase [Cytophagales bacterium]
MHENSIFSYTYHMPVMNNAIHLYITRNKDNKDTRNCEKILLYYQGTLNNALVGSLTQYLRKKLDRSKPSHWKVHTIFTEMAQNIALYSADRAIFDKNEAIGLVLVKEYKDTYEITTTNLVTQQQVYLLKTRCEEINNLNTEELRKFKNQLLEKSTEINRKAGANIGLVQVALIAKNKLDYHILPLDTERAVFQVSVSVAKS